MPNYIKADQFFYPHGVRRGGYLELVDGKFGKHVEQIPEGAEVIDYTGYSIA
ncbi:MAG: N-acetylglucosamine-6-phosphate deacetylase, partial [Streptococcus mitis]|nr:N-acetylglucosamine-6-phosphate deacetylase [Streptococcus mitis]